MIARATCLSLFGCAAASFAFHAGQQAEGEPARPVATYAEMPLAAVPIVRDAEMLGLSFARIGIVADAGAADGRTVEAFVIDALHDAALGQPNGVAPRPPYLVSGQVLATAMPVRLRRVGAPFHATRIVQLQSEHRSPDRLRALAERKTGG